MITQAQIQRLRANWGERADSLACNCEVRLYDANGPWECYIYAINPEDETEIMAIIKAEIVETCTCNLSDLQAMYDSTGNPLKIDRCFRPRHAEVILKRLQENL